jgi:hypothetical protein
MIRAGNSRLHGHLLGRTSSAHVAQSVEHILGKDEVTGSNPVMGLLPGAAIGKRELGTEKEDTDLTTTG